MADAEQKKNRSRGTTRKGRHLPVKRSINLAETGEKKVNMSIGFPAILLILALAFAFGKFAVADRLIEVSKAQGEVAAVQRQVDDGYRRIEDFGELADTYAHYTFSGMTEEEVQRADRIEVIELIRTVMMPSVKIDTWKLEKNKLTVDVTGATLEAINRMAQKIEAEDIVDFCSVKKANTNETKIDGRTLVTNETDVSAHVEVYLKPNEGGSRA